jgi:hypothetical protein
MFALVAIAALSFSAPAMAQSIGGTIGNPNTPIAPIGEVTVTHNANPTNAPFTYGAGNDYLPANATVLTDTRDGGNDELSARFHIAGLAANPSVDGVYAFALGTSNISFDYSIFGNAAGGTVTLTNLLTGDVASFATALIADANGLSAGYQGSQQLGFGFLNGSFPPFGDLNFNANIDNTYRFDLSAGGNTVTTFAQVGAGAGAVPEPATWAMMLLGFGAVGVSIRRQRKPVLAQTA